MQENANLTAPQLVTIPSAHTYAAPTSGIRPKPDIAHVILFCVLGLCGQVDLIRGFGVAGVTGLGMLTIVGGAAAWAAWLSRPTLPNDLLKPLLPLIMFELYTAGTLLWSGAGMASLQLLAVGVSFLGLIILTARETERSPAFARRLYTAVLLCSIPSVLMYFYVYWEGGMGADGFILARSYALYAMIPIAVALARWQTGNKWALAWAGVLLLFILLSLSRTAMVACIMLFPLAVALRGTRKNIVLAAAILIVSAAAFFTAMLTYEPLYERFFAYDASMNVGGVNVNASGRTKMWNLVLDNLGDDWVFGKGIGESGALISQYFPKMGQPHNDFLRFYYDLGIIGFSMWLIFMGTLISLLVRNLRRAVRMRSPDYAIYLAPLLAFTAVSGSMFTDNSVSYSFVMMPLAIVIGCSVGAGRKAMIEEWRSLRR